MMDAPSRMEKMVGELIGLRMLVAQLLENEAARSGTAATEATRAAALAATEAFAIGSDTPEGAERIKYCALAMLRAFPAPNPVP